MKIDSCTIEGKSFKQNFNQDNFFMKEEFLNEKEQFLIGICNGHGKHGKLISKYLINMSVYIRYSINHKKKISSDKDIFFICFNLHIDLFYFLYISLVY